VKPPQGYRQTREGYWLGPQPELRDVPFLTHVGVKLAIGAVPVSGKVMVELVNAGIRRLSAPMGSTFRGGGRILEAVQEVEPHEVFIHCQHGADRTGCIAAFLLCVRHGWNIPDAFYSVLYPSSKDTGALAELLENELGAPDRRYPEDESVGFYSHAACGLPGGLKARSGNYRRLITSTIEAIKVSEGWSRD
jgi:hypothetical protein